jgi:hypothetical protein
VTTVDLVGREPFSTDVLLQPVRRYPVLVVEHLTRVLWVEAEDAAEALAYVKQDICEYLDANDYGSKAQWWGEESLPEDDYDWEIVERHGDAGGYPGTQADAHVQTHRDAMYRQERAAKRRACALGGHPGAVRGFCPQCGNLSDGTSAQGGAAC